MWTPATKYLYGLTSSFGVSVNVSREAEDAVDAEIRAAQQDHAADRIAGERRAFRTFLTHPSTSARLDAMLADNERIDAQLREDDRRDDAREGDGNQCGSACGYCGRCS
jgi:hypothetical protein